MVIPHTTSRTSSPSSSPSSSSSSSSSSPSSPQPTHNPSTVTQPTNRRTSNTLDCPICFSLLSNPVVTSCGHSFCTICLSAYLGFAEDSNTNTNFDHNKRPRRFNSHRLYHLPFSSSTNTNTNTKPCPICHTPLGNSTAYPSTTLASLVEKARNNSPQLLSNRILSQPNQNFNSTSTTTNDQPSHPITNNSSSNLLNDLDVNTIPSAQVDRLLAHLLERKSREANQTDYLISSLLNPFLQRCHKEKHSALTDINRDISVLETDLARLRFKSSSTNSLLNLSSSNSILPTNIQARASIVEKYHDNVKTTYFENRKHGDSEQALTDFGQMLIGATAYSNASRRTSIQQMNILKSNDVNNLITSIEFNPTSTLVATAGVMKRIKIFEFQSLLESSESVCNDNDDTDRMEDGNDESANEQKFPTDSGSSNEGSIARRKILSKSGIGDSRTKSVSDDDDVTAEELTHHFPVLEIPTQNKLSCLSWNQQDETLLAASTHKGEILIHDTHSNVEVQTLTEHRRRTWFINFSTQQPNLLLSGSDDKTVKLWDIGRQATSTMTLQTSASVCCVKFNPYDLHEFAFGSADHNIYSYDIRHARTPLCVFEGHWRAVSHVLYLNRSELVSASTDSSCKLWNVQKQQSGLSYNGHSNQRNFVGLCGSRDFFACGSEDSAVYVYHKRFPGPVVRYGFGAGGSFVSTVAWKPDSNFLVAANDVGSIEVIDLQ